MIRVCQCVSKIPGKQSWRDFFEATKLWRVEACLCEGLLVQVASLQDKPKFEDGEKNDDDEAEKENKENQQENKQDKHEEKAEKPKKDKQDKHKPTKAEKLAKQASAEVVTECPWMMSKLQKTPITFRKSSVFSLKGEATGWEAAGQKA